MADEGKRLIIDDDWKEQARREKERLAEQEARTAQQGEAPPASIADLINMLAIQAMVGMGMVGTPTGERIPPNLEVARHFIDLIEVLREKTKNNLTAEEKRVLELVLYDLRMKFVEVLKMGAGVPPAEAVPPTPGAAT